MAYSHFDKFKAFFLALNKSEYHPERMDPKIITPQDKAYCFEWLLKEIPELKGKSNNDLIEFLRDPKKVKTCIAGHFVQKESTELTKTLAEKPAAEEAGGQPSGTETAPTTQETPPPTGQPGSGMPGMGMPAGPSVSPISRPPRIIIHDIPHTESGMAGGQGAGNAASSKIDRLEAQKAGSAAAAKSPETKQPTTVTNRTVPAPQKFNYPAFQSRFSTAAKNVQNFVGRANPFLKTNLNRIGQGLWNMGKLGTGGVFNFGTGTGSRILDTFGGFRSPGGIGGSRSIFGRISRLGKGRGISGARSLAGKAKGRGMLWFFLGIFGLMGLTGILGFTGAGQTDSVPTGTSSLLPGAGSDLDRRYNFTAFNIFDINAVEDSLLKKYIDRALATGKIKSEEQKTLLPSRAKFIRDQAQMAGLNPAIFLGYWESESAFSDYLYPGVRPGMDLGCDPTNKALKTFEESVFCAVGKSQISNSRTSQCAVSKNINSPACQAITFQQAEGVKLPISTLKDFLDSYGSKRADPNNIKSDNIVKQTIADLGLVPYIAAPPPGSPPTKDFALTCPIPNQEITCPSYWGELKPPYNCRHCGQNYLSKDACETAPATKYGIDIKAEENIQQKTSKLATIPYLILQGPSTTPESIACQYVPSARVTKCADLPECHTIYQYRCSSPRLTNDIYLQYHHIRANSNAEKTLNSGDSVGYIAYYDNTLARLNFQLGIGGPCAGGETNCVPGEQYVQCQ